MAWNSQPPPIPHQLQQQHYQPHLHPHQNYQIPPMNNYNYYYPSNVNSIPNNSQYPNYNYSPPISVSVSQTHYSSTPHQQFSSPPIPHPNMNSNSISPSLSATSTPFSASALVNAIKLLQTNKQFNFPQSAASSSSSTNLSSLNIPISSNAHENSSNTLAADGDDSSSAAAVQASACTSGLNLSSLASLDSSSLNSLLDSIRSVKSSSIPIIPSYEAPNNSVANPTHSTSHSNYTSHSITTGPNYFPSAAAIPMNSVAATIAIDSARSLHRLLIHEERLLEARELTEQHKKTKELGKIVNSITSSIINKNSINSTPTIQTNSNSSKSSKSTAATAIEKNKEKSSNHSESKLNSSISGNIELLRIKKIEIHRLATENRLKRAEKEFNILKSNEEFNHNQSLSLSQSHLRRSLLDQTNNNDTIANTTTNTTTTTTTTNNNNNNNSTSTGTIKMNKLNGKLNSSSQSSNQLNSLESSPFEFSRERKTETIQKIKQQMNSTQLDPIDSDEEEYLRRLPSTYDPSKPARLDSFGRRVQSALSNRSAGSAKLHSFKASARGSFAQAMRKKPNSASTAAAAAAVKPRIPNASASANAGVKSAAASSTVSLKRSNALINHDELVDSSASPSPKKLKPLLGRGINKLAGSSAIVSLFSTKSNKK